MSLDATREAIAAKIESVPGTGIVHRYERYAHDQRQFRKLYETGGKVLGWQIRRVATRELRDGTGYVRIIHRWQIRGFMSLVDDDASETVFDNLVETIRQAFRNDPSLGGMVDTQSDDFTDGQPVGLQVEDSGPTMFAGVLCHGVQMSLTTNTDDEVGVAVLDDFVTGNVEYDLGGPAGDGSVQGPDGEIEAEDNIEPEQS